MRKQLNKVLVIAFILLNVIGIGLIRASEQTPLFEAIDSAERLPSNEQFLRSRLVSADLQQFNNRSYTLQLNLFDDATFTATGRLRAGDSAEQSLWRGTLEGVSNSNVLITMRSGVMAGLIDADGRRYRIQWRGDGDLYAIHELDMAWNWLEAAPIPIFAPNKPEVANRILSDDGTVIDILVAYTDGARQYYGSTAATLTELDLAIAESNQAYQNSNINTQLRLVHTVEVDYTASSNMSNDLNRIQRPDDGYMDSLHTLRDTYKADLVHLISEYADSGVCGRAYLMSTLSAGFEEWAFGVTRADCTTGRYIFAHEVGHNMGSEHNPSNAQGTPLTSYSYGHWGSGDNFRTVMAYSCPTSCPIVGHFSDPNINYNGAPTGVANSQDNARSIRSVLTTLANFRVSDDGPPDPSGTVAVRVSASADDVEERLDTGSINSTSSDLELIDDSSLRGEQTVGIRFQNVTVPQGAAVTSAYLRFRVDEADSGSTNLTIYGVAADSAGAFGSADYSVSSQPKTSQSVAWSAIPAWSNVGSTQQSPDISSVVQTLVNRGGWQSGNSMAFVITGSGERTASSYDNDSAYAPQLVIEYETDPPTPTPTPSGTPPTATPTPEPSDAVNFAIIGDFGTDDSFEAAVATLVASWNPDFIGTAGDNVYGSHTFDESVGKYYCDFVKDVTPDDSPVACNGGNSSVNRFFPSPGNHDHDDGPTSNLNDYLSYFNLPGAGVPTSGTSGSELFYDARQGSVHLFLLDSESISNAGGVGSAPYNEQRAWLQAQLAASDAEWKLVLMHHPPYSSARHGSNSWMQWPYVTWGADAVIGGHDHTYERIIRDGIPYFVNGMGGRGFYSFNTPISGSAVRYNSQHGAMRGTATDNGLVLEFINTSGEVIDRYEIGEAPPTPTPTPQPTLPASGVVDVRIALGSDDAEQNESSGEMYLTSTDLELVDDSGYFGDQLVGLRFQNIGVPPNATIEAAYIEFTVEASNSGTTNLVIHGESADDAATYTSATSDMSSRPTTGASVNWSNIAAWTTTGAKQTSPDLKAIVQEIVDRPGWNAYQDMAFVLTGSGERAAESYEGDPALAPLLRIEYTTGSDPVPTSTPTAVPTETPTPTQTPQPADMQLLIDDYHVSSGQQITVMLQARDVSASGLGSVNVDVMFDETVLSVVGCSADPNTLFDIRLCNPSAATDKVTFGLTASTGPTGDMNLGYIVFQASGGAGDNSDLTITANTLVDNGSQPLPVTLSHGSVVLSELGDVNCSGARDLIDAQHILQYSVGLRTDHDSCELPVNTIYTPLCDVSGDTICDVFDALLIVQCAIGINNTLCPSSRAISVAPPSGNATQIGIGAKLVGLGETVSMPISATIGTGDSFATGTIALYYDPDIVSATDCNVDSDLMGACNVAYENDGVAPDVMIFSVIAPSGATGVVDLIDVSFTGEGIGDSVITIDVRSLRNASGEELVSTAESAVVTVTNSPSSVGLVGSWATFGRYQPVLLVGLILLTVTIGLLRYRRP